MLIETDEIDWEKRIVSYKINESVIYENCVLISRNMVNVNTLGVYAIFLTHTTGPHEGKGEIVYCNEKGQVKIGETWYRRIFNTPGPNPLAVPKGNMDPVDISKLENGGVF